MKAQFFLVGARKHFERHCADKIRHKTAAAADAQAKGLTKLHPGEEFERYECHYKELHPEAPFHVGHKKGEDHAAAA